eukprot:CAMPEP_0204320058 /NCGR_PEP_ID=MMETSP0469-20131031/7448_1 /ASSEMBLY_ACC=CAM_ASM_000384 /TAXON_ID=2969 /ORGANISM="Oxyrrhis marina" /LENGTH=525 /DNA_ID=CAMNT_0051301309 /DNA_START=29 /DNA_END=1606 /DNA_ORIENTATION=+
MPVHVPKSGTPLSTQGDVASSFLKQAAEIFAGYLKDNMQPNSDKKVQIFASPDQIEAAFKQAGLDVALKEGDGPAEDSLLLAACRVALEYSIRSGHELYFNQLYARPDPASIVGDWLAAVAHQNVHTYEAAPVFSMIEKSTLAKLARLWQGTTGPAADPVHEGLFVPGGSIANLYGMLLARYWKRPSTRNEGTHGGKKLVGFTSSESHYSWQKCAMMTGLGLENMVKVPCSTSGAMDPQALREAVQAAVSQGHEPFFVGATAGTTVAGAYDPFTELAAVCKEFGLWMHVDAAWGGSALLSPKLRAKYCPGIDLADSITIDPHKFMGMVIQCAAFLTTRTGLLKQCNGMSAAYLFQPDKNNTDLDIGDMTIQCGRRADAFKLWLAWKSKGDEVWAAEAERGEALSAHIESRVSDPADGRFALALPRTGNNVCFWVVPKALARDGKFSMAKATKEEVAQIGQVAPKVKDRMQRTGDALIGFQVVMGLPNCFRIVISSPSRVSVEALDAMLDRMAVFAEEAVRQPAKL